MKTKSQVLEEFSEYKSLINAVISRVGMESVNDIMNYGISGGFHGFICHADTTKFFKKYRNDILKLAENMASDLGEDLLTMIQGFNCLGKDYPINEIGKAIYSGKGDCATEVQNAMAWFAAEEVCRMFDN